MLPKQCGHSINSQYLSSKWHYRLIALVSMLLALASTPTLSAIEPGWALSLNSTKLGQIYIYFTVGGFAIVYPKTGVKFVTHAPNWQVIMYNDTTRTYHIESAADLNGNDFAKQPKQQLSKTAQQINSTATKGSTTLIAGLPASKYTLLSQSEQGAQRTQAWVTNNIKPPVQLKLLLSKIMQADLSELPGGMPLRAQIWAGNGRCINSFDTIRIEQQKISSASFNCPTNYSCVDNELAVCIDKKHKQQVDDLLKNADILNSLLAPEHQGRTGRR